MEPKQAMKQVMEFNRMAFDNVFNALNLVQEQTAKLTALSLEQTTMLPKEGKKVFTEWLEACRKGSETLKKSVDDGFQRLEAIIA
jgi:hypothetical protein